MATRGSANHTCTKHRSPETPVVLARSVGRADERDYASPTWNTLIPSQADMQTLIIIGSSTTRELELATASKLIYTPRSYTAYDFNKPLVVDRWHR